jgi:succinylglutamic semialdehyde dehydrogenase
VLNLLQGGVETATALASHQGVNGLFFTGSSRAGLALSRVFAETPERLLALEMGGNNALVVDAPSDLMAAALLTVQSAFQSAGQRCNCARRLLITRRTDPRFLDHLFEISRSLNIGEPEITPEPFCGPLISPEAVEAFLRAQNDLKRMGARVLLGGSALRPGTGFVSPAIFDVTGVADLPDEETFGPLLTIRFVKDIDEAIRETNATRYGLAAGILSDDAAVCDRFRREARAGVINCNLPLNAASSAVPFGGLGLSGNFRPSAYFAIDSCVYPVATLDAEKVALPGQVPAGVNLPS